MAGKGRPFGADNPGNTAGRPKGARNRTTQAVEAILDGQAEALTQKAVEMALSGDGPAMRLCLDRLCPPRKDRVVQFDMPAIDKVEDVPTATAALMQAVADGDLTPSEARDVSAVIGVHVEAIKTVDLDRRLARIEEALKCTPSS